MMIYDASGQIDFAATIGCHHEQERDMSSRFTDDDDKALLAMDAQGIKPLVMGVRIGRETAAVVRRLRTIRDRAERQSNGYARGPLSEDQKEAIREGQRAARQRRAAAEK